MIFELREYHAMPGKFGLLVERFENHTFELLRKHGFRIVWSGITEVGSHSTNELSYVLEFESVQDWETKWAAMLSDPDWLAVKASSEIDGPLVASVQRRLFRAFPHAGVNP